MACCCCENTEFTCGLGVGAFTEEERECVWVCCETIRVHDGEGGFGPPELELGLFDLGTGVCSRDAKLEDAKGIEDIGGWFDENTSGGTPIPMMLLLVRNWGY